MNRVPYPANSIRREIVQLKGINYTNNYTDGDLEDSKNITIDKFPYISTAKANSKLEGEIYGNANALAVYNALVIFSDTKAYLGTEEVASGFTASPKTTATVNGKMIVYPDARIIVLHDDYTITGMGIIDSSMLISWLEHKGISPIGEHRFYFGKYYGERDDLNGTLSANGIYKMTTGGTKTIGSATVTYTAGDYVLVEGDPTDPSSLTLIPKAFMETAGEKIKLYDAGWLYCSNPANNSNGFLGGITDTRKFGVYRTPYSTVAVATNEKDRGFCELSGRWNSDGFYHTLNEQISGDVTIDGVKYQAEVDMVYFDANYYNTDSVEISATKYVLEDYSGVYNDGITFRRIYYENLEDRLNEGDSVAVIHNDETTMCTVTSIDSTKNAIVLKKVADSTTYTFTSGERYILRFFEKPDYFCESNNRLWCCNNEKQLIYCSSLGKPTEFHVDTDIATGGFDVTTGDPEPFTACCKYESSVLFFKQNRIYKILGSSPKNYELFTYETEGVKSGCNKSICTINGILYFVGLHGVYAYSGGTPVCISSSLGNIDMENAVGGTDGERYYLSFTSGNTDYLFVYEPKYNAWIKKDNIKVVDFARTTEGFYYLDSNKQVYAADTGETPNDMEWYAQFKPFYETIEGKKRYSKLIIRAKVGKGAYMKAKIRADGMIWKEVGVMKSNTENAQTMRIPIERCDKFELRIEGAGKCEILSILREFEIGGERE